MLGHIYIELSQVFCMQVWIQWGIKNLGFYFNFMHTA